MDDQDKRKFHTVMLKDVKIAVGIFFLKKSSPNLGDTAANGMTETVTMAKKTPKKQKTTL